MSRLAVLVVALAAGSFAACAGHRMPGSAPPLPVTGGRPPTLLEVGTARADITPPPGPSTFGHGPDALVAQGYWSRLYCRIFLFVTAPEHRVALVACDLHSISTILHRSVAERVRAIVPTSRLLMAATHTHAGPAHYFDSPVYSGLASTRRPGFDPAMVDFLAERIARAIERAFAARSPVASRWVHTSAWQLTRNRSLEASRANANGELWQPPASLMLSEEEKAIDPSLHVLQLEALDPTRKRMLGPAGWLVFFAMHPTVVGSRNRLFGADAFGATSRLLEAELRRAWANRCAQRSEPECARLEDLDPLVAVLNTNEGDIAPVRSSGTTTEAVRVGRALAERAWATYAEDLALLRVWSSGSVDHAGFRNDAVVESRYLEADLPDAPIRPGGKERLCPGAELGTASGHGASDHPVSFDSLLGTTDSDVDPDRRDCQAPKRKMLGILQRLLVGDARTSFPTHAPFALLRVDDTWLSLVPGEPTIHAGAVINARVRSAVTAEDGRPAHALVVGLANAYFQYLTTREEYGVQAYEGASTLYGPSSADYFAERFFQLARSMNGFPIDGELGPGQYRLGEAVAFSYQTGPVRARLPVQGDAPSLLSLGASRRQRGLCRLPQRAPPGICFWWSDGAPARVAIPDGPWLSMTLADSNEPVRACQAQRALSSPWEALCDPGALIDDRGLAFETRVRGRTADEWLWSTVFQASPEHWASIVHAGPVRLAAAGADGAAPVRSEAFSSAELPSLCSAEAVRFCLGEGEPDHR